MLHMCVVSIACSCSLPQTTRTLRVFVSHTVSGQPWQVGEAEGEGEGVNFETGQGIPAWSLKVEGRLLEVRPVSGRLSFPLTEKEQLPNQRSRDKTAPRKFSTFIKRMIVELDRDPHLYPDGNIVEVCRECYIRVYLIEEVRSGLVRKVSNRRSMALRSDARGTNRHGFEF